MSAFSKVLNEASAIKAMLEKVLKAQQEQALQEFTVTTTTTVSPTNMASVVVMSKTPPLSSSDAISPTLTPTMLIRAPMPLGGGHTMPPTPVRALVHKDVIPTYRLNREIHTIPELWRLWTEGIGGAPSVKELDRQYGSGWRQTTSERQYYSMRKTLIDEIKRRTKEACDGDFA